MEIKHLGCFKAPNSNRWQLQAITSKCDDFAQIANTSSLTRLEAHLMCQAIHHLSVGFPLPMCHFTFEELDRAGHRRRLTVPWWQSVATIGIHPWQRCLAPLGWAAPHSSTSMICKGSAKSPAFSSIGGAPKHAPARCFGSQSHGCSFAQASAPL